VPSLPTREKYQPPLAGVKEAEPEIPRAQYRWLQTIPEVLRVVRFPA